MDVKSMSLGKIMCIGFIVMFVAMSLGSSVTAKTYENPHNNNIINLFRRVLNTFVGLFFNAVDVKRNERPNIVETPIPEITAESGKFIFSSILICINNKDNKIFMRLYHYLSEVFLRREQMY